MSGRAGDFTDCSGVSCSSWEPHLIRSHATAVSHQLGLYIWQPQAHRKTCTQITHSCKTKAKQPLQLFTAWMQSLPNSREWKNSRRATFQMEQRVQAADTQKKPISLVTSFHFFPHKRGPLVCRTVPVVNRPSWGAAQGANTPSPIPSTPYWGRTPRQELTCSAPRGLFMNFVMDMLPMAFLLADRGVGCRTATPGTLPPSSFPAQGTWVT